MIKIDWIAFMKGRVILGFYLVRDVPAIDTVEYDALTTLEAINALPMILKWQWKYPDRPPMPWHRCKYFGND